MEAVLQELRAQSEIKDPRVQPAIRDLLERRALEAIKVQTEIPDPEALLDLPGHKDLKARPDLPERRALEAIKVQPEIKDRRAPQDQEAPEADRALRI